MPCMTCLFSEAPRDETGKVVIGAYVRVCKRLPPGPIFVPRASGLSLESAWPIVPLNEFCHEFQERVSPTAEPAPKTDGESVQ